MVLKRHCCLICTSNQTGRQVIALNNKYSDTFIFNNLGKNKGKSRQFSIFKKRLFDMFVQQIITLY